MPPGDLSLADLQTMHEIAHTLNRALDVRSALETSLQKLVELVGLQTGWIFVRDPLAAERWAGRGYALAAYCDLPPALSVNRHQAWDKGCSCQTLCTKGELIAAYNEVHCSRLAETTGDKRGLKVHASTPLQSGEKVLGILNVAAAEWEAFDERALTLLTTVGDQIGVALERAQLYDALRVQRVEEQATLLSLSQLLLGHRPAENLAEVIVEEVRRLLKVDGCMLMLPIPGQEALHVDALSGWRLAPPRLLLPLPTGAGSKIGRVVQDQKPLVSRMEGDEPGATLDRWAQEEGFYSMAAVPLVVEDKTVGVLVVHAREVRDFHENDLRFLQLMANQAAIALEAARLRREEAQVMRLERELALGRQIQGSMLPDNAPAIPGWEFAVAYHAATEVGGDFYDFFALEGEPDRWGIVIADVADKGVPAALYMVLSRTSIRSAALPERRPAETLRLTNQYILQDSQAHMFLSAFYGVLDVHSGALIYSNAGHNFPLVWRAASSDVVELTKHGILLGVVQDLQVEDHDLELAAGDILIMYTDGVTEAVNDNLDEFGTGRLRRTIRQTLSVQRWVSAQDLVDAILVAVDEHRQGAQQIDDITLFVIRRREATLAG